MWTLCCSKSHYQHVSLSFLPFMINCTKCVEIEWLNENSHSHSYEDDVGDLVLQNEMTKYQLHKKERNIKMINLMCCTVSLLYTFITRNLEHGIT